MKEFYKVTEIITDYLSNNLNINNVTIGSIDEVDLNKQSIFPLAHIIMGPVTFAEATAQFSVDILLMDSVYEAQNSVKEEIDTTAVGNNNLQDVMNTMLVVANGLQATLRRGALYANNFVLLQDPTVEPFQDRFTTLVAGWQISLVVQIPNIDINTCEYIPNINNGGYSGYSGSRSGTSGWSGYSGRSGYSGTSGTSGFSGYSGVSPSNYISISREDLYTLISNSTLIPQQWYLITNYQTENTIIGSAPSVIHFASVERIFVQAITLNTLSPNAISADHPNETVIYKQTIDPDYGNVNNYYESGEDSGPNTVSDFTTNGFTIDTGGHPMTDPTTFYCDGNDYGSGANFDVNAAGYGKYQFSTYYYGGVNTGNNNVVGTSTTQIAVDTVDIDFSSYANDGSFSLHVHDMVNDVEYNYTQSDLGEKVEITGSKINYIGGDSSVDWTGCETNMYANSTEDSYTLTSGGVFTLLHRNNIDFTNIANPDVGGYFEIGWTYISKVYYGRIVHRDDWVRNLHIDEDFYGIQHYRWKATAPAWSAGTYAAGSVVSNGGWQYLAQDIMTVSPVTANAGWVPLLAPSYTNQYYLPNQTVYVGVSLPISADITVAPQAKGMFANPNSTQLKDITIKNTSSSDLDVVFLSDNQSINISASYALTVTDLMHDCNFNITDATIIKTAYYSSGEIRGGFIEAMNTVNFDTSYRTYHYNTYEMDFGFIGESTFGGSFTQCRATSLSQVKIYNYCNVNDINYMYQCTFKSYLSNNIIENMATSTFLYEIRNCNFYGQASLNTVTGSMTGVTCFGLFSQNNISNNFSYNFIQSNFISNVISGTWLYNTFKDDVSSNVFNNASSQVLHNTFLSMAGNSFTGACNILNCTFASEFSSNVGNDPFTLQYFNGSGTFKSNTFNAGSSPTQLIYLNCLGNFQTNTFKYTAFQSGTMLGNYIGNIHDGSSGMLDFRFNIFQGNSQNNHYYNGNFRYNTCGGEFNSNTMTAAATIQYNIYPYLYSIQTLINMNNFTLTGQNNMGINCVPTVNSLFRISSLPSSTSGLVTGEFWRDSNGFVKMV